MKNSVKHLGKWLSIPQAAALTFALTEGEVGLNANGFFNYTTCRIRANTLRYLVGAGLLVSNRKDGAPHSDDWFKLTAWGESVARKLFELDRGRPWDSGQYA